MIPRCVKNFDSREHHIVILPTVKTRISCERCEIIMVVSITITAF